MIKRHLGNVLAFLKHRITNAASEGLNSKIQAVKAAARGFRNFENYRIAILFHCEGLQLYPQETQ
jgi:transposase